MLKAIGQGVIGGLISAGCVFVTIGTFSATIWAYGEFIEKKEKK